MNAPKCTEYDYTSFLVAAQQVFNAVEVSPSHAAGEQQVAHDAIRDCCNECRRIARRCGWK